MGTCFAQSLIVSHAHLAQMRAHAFASAPDECCGLMGGNSQTRRITALYPLRNVASKARTAYEAAPADLFAAQKAMRAMGEQLLGIYHSHPRSHDPAPSTTDVRLAFYPDAVYFIIGVGDVESKEEEAPIGAFRLYEAEERWERAEFSIAED